MGTNQSAGSGPTADPPLEDRKLRVVLEVARGGPCVMDDIDGEVIDIDVRFKGGCCNVDAKVRDTEEGVATKYFSNELCSYCPGKVFSDLSCLPRYRQIRDGSFVLETYASDTDTVAEIVGNVREICETVSVRSITPSDDGQCEEFRTVDVSALTPKQREAVVHAQESGYYDPDSDTSLEEVAERMDVSQSALSQRLKRAEANVLRQLSCECPCGLNSE